MTHFTILCQINGGCMGCCGHDFISKEKIKTAIALNTKEFEQINPKVKAQFMKFRDRAYPSDLRDGVCRNLIEKEGQFFCPLHPSKNNDEDLRIGHCDTHYLCKTAKAFAQWDQEKKEQFLQYLKKQNLDNIIYSMKMDNDTLLKEFESQ